MNLELEDNPQKFKGVWIPFEVWEAEKLTWSMRCLWATISSLGRNAENPCFASNQWLADRMGTTVGNLANQISTMRKLGFIEEIGFDGRRRTMLAVVPVKAAPTPGLKQGSPRSEGCPNTWVQPSIEENKAKNKEEKDLRGSAQDLAPKEPKEEVQAKELFHSEKPEANAKVVAKAKPAGNPQHKEVIEGWFTAYGEVYGDVYRVTPRDAKAVKDFLSSGPIDVAELVATVKQAWKAKSNPKNFRCLNQSNSLHAFLGAYNDIKGELRKPTTATPGAVQRADKLAKEFPEATQIRYL